MITVENMSDSARADADQNARAKPNRPGTQPGHRTLNAGAVVENGRLCFRPVSGPAQSIDVTEGLVSALAYQLWQRFGGAEMVNWLEAEVLVHSLLNQLEATRVPAAPAPQAQDGYASLPPHRPPAPRARKAGSRRSARGSETAA